MKTYFKFLVGLVLCMSFNVQALDLGVYGNTWPIIEQDIRVRMSEDAAKVDWATVNEGVVADAENKLNNYNKFLPAAMEQKISTVDISVVLSEDFIVQLPTPGGGTKSKVLYNKGYVLNPLDFIKPWQSKKYLIFNAASQQELEFAKNLYNKNPSGYLFFTTQSANQQLDFPIYPVDTWFLTTAKVSATPTLVGIAINQPRLLTKAQLTPPFLAAEAIKVFE